LPVAYLAAPPASVRSLRPSALALLAAAAAAAASSPAKLPRRRRSRRPQPPLPASRREPPPAPPAAQNQQRQEQRLGRVAAVLAALGLQAPTDRASAGAALRLEQQLQAAAGSEQRGQGHPTLRRDSRGPVPLQALAQAQADFPAPARLARLAAAGGRAGAAPRAQAAGLSFSGPSALQLADSVPPLDSVPLRASGQQQGRRLGCERR
jgi:hypothetical protein